MSGTPFRGVDDTLDWDTIKGLRQVKDVLDETVIIPFRFSNLFENQQQHRPCRTVLLHGPPGVGKTMLGRAIGARAGGGAGGDGGGGGGGHCWYARASACDFISKYRGNSTAIVKSLFDAAAKNAPSVIFLDDIDSLDERIEERRSNAIGDIRREIIDQLNSIDSSDNTQQQKKTIVIAATASPWRLTDEFVYSFSHRLYCPMPSPDDRAEMLRALLFDDNNSNNNNNNNNTSPPRSLVSYDEDIRVIADELTDGFTGADIHVLVRQVTMMPVREVFAALKQQESGDTQQALRALQESDLRPTCLADFVVATLERNGLKRCVNSGEIMAHHEWNAEYGAGMVHFR